MTVWQIAAGESGRYYDDLFLKWNIMFMGPGQFGAYDPSTYGKCVASKILTKHKNDQLCKFANEVEPGQLVLLRKGYTVTCVGIVADQPYVWDRRFDDVYGWDLQHTRRVIWQTNTTPRLLEIQEYSPDDERYRKPLFGGRKQIPTFTRVDDVRVIEPIRHLLNSQDVATPEPIDLNVPEPLTLDQLGELLFAKGLSNDSVEEVLDAIRRQRRLGKWYQTQRDSGRPAEHEVVAHMILPLLLGLGWSEQLLAVEWQRIDLAGFRSTPTGKDSCVLLCEAKQMWYPLQPALDQARGYVDSLGLTHCKRIMLTDGVRIYVYRKNNDLWSDQPSGYVNMNLIRLDHLAPQGVSAVDTLMELTPGAQ